MFTTVLTELCPHQVIFWCPWKISAQPHYWICSVLWLLWIPLRYLVRLTAPRNTFSPTSTAATAEEVGVFTGETAAHNLQHQLFVLQNNGRHNPLTQNNLWTSEIACRLASSWTICVVIRRQSCFPVKAFLAFESLSIRTMKLWAFHDSERDKHEPIRGGVGRVLQGKQWIHYNVYETFEHPIAFPPLRLHDRHASGRWLLLNK